MTGTAHSSPASPDSRPPSSRLALYRRYRPATFAEVRGQEHVTEPLSQALRNGRVHHAYLFSGPRGCGKTSSARILARSLNCVEGPTPEPCGKCESCIALAPSGPGSIDVIEIDAASHGGVDDARDLRERAFYAPVAGRFKVYIIDEAHMVTREGFNALLKLVEEPPPHLKFVFATTEPEKVIPTIRSRTHHYPFRLVAPAVLRELLDEILRAEGAQCQPSVLPLVVRAGAGSVRDSLSVLDQLLAGSGEEGVTYERAAALLGYTDDTLLDEMVDALAAGDGAAAFGALDRAVQSGHDPRRFAGDLLDRLRDLIIMAAVPGAGETGLLDAPADRLETIASQAGRFARAELARAAGLLSEALVQMRGTTAPRLMLELAVAQILVPGAGEGDKTLLARLERLEHRLSNGQAPSEGSGPPSAPPRTTPAPPARTTAARTPPAPAAAKPAPESPAAAEPSAVAPPPAAPPSAPSSAGSARSSSGSPEKPAGHPAAPPTDQPGEHPSAPPADTTAPDSNAAPSGAAPARTPAPDGGSAIPADAVALRQRWPEVLAAVQEERKLAWIQLRGAEVASLDSGVLTVAFSKEGEARGFTGSGSDQVLTGVLGRLFGLIVRVQAAGGPIAVGSPPAGGFATEQGSPHGSATGHPGVSPVGSAQREDMNPGDRVPSPATSPEGQRRHAMPGPGAQSPASAGGSAPAAAPSGQGRSSAAHNSPQEEEWPDDAGAEPGGASQGGGLTGMELIQQQLGGRVIAEIEEP